MSEHNQLDKRGIDLHGQIVNAVHPAMKAEVIEVFDCGPGLIPLGEGEDMICIDPFGGGGHGGGGNGGGGNGGGGGGGGGGKVTPPTVKPVVRIEGHAHAIYDRAPGGYKDRRDKTENASGCGCREGQRCVQATGAIEATFHVTTTKDVIAPVPPGLKPCQEKRYREAIAKLQAHENEHEQRLKTYDATWFHPYDLTVCETKLEGELNVIFDNEVRDREIRVNDYNSRLDPHYEYIDLNC